MKELLESERRKFSKLMELEGFGYDELLKLKNSKLAVVGLSGIGLSTLLTTISSGVSHVKVVDFSTINEHVLPQGTFFSKGDIGKLKTIAVKEKLMEQRLAESVEISNVELRDTNIEKVLGDYEIIVYASYHRDTLNLIANHCIAHNKPLIWTVGCHYTSYLLYASPEMIPAYLEAVIREVNDCFRCDCYYPSYLSSIAGGAVASLVINAMLGRAQNIFRKCNVNTLQVEYIQPN